jgi:hypothetical protein
MRNTRGSEATLVHISISAPRVILRRYVEKDSRVQYCILLSFRAIVHVQMTARRRIIATSFEAEEFVNYGRMW